MVYAYSTEDSFKKKHNVHFAQEATAIKAKEDIIVIDTSELGTSRELLTRGVIPERIRCINRSKTQMALVKSTHPGLKTHAVSFNKFASSYKRPVRAAYIDSCSPFVNVQAGISYLFNKGLFVHRSVLFITCVFRGGSGGYDKKLYRQWVKDGMTVFEDDTPCIQQANVHIVECAWKAGYRVSRYTQDKVAKSQYRPGVYLLRYVVLKV